MAKQVGPLFFTGTVDGMIFYKVGEQYLMRSKGSYKSAKHMRRNPRYQRTTENADRFGSASQLTQAIYYRHVPKPHRKQGVYGKLTGLFYGWLYGGKTIEEAQALLIAHCQVHFSATKKQPPKSNNDQSSLNTVPSPLVNEQRSTVNAQEQRSTVNHKPKQARYLSQWKVKQNGRLHIPAKVALIDPGLLQQST